MNERGYLWRDLAEEIVFEFKRLSEPEALRLEEIAARAVPGEIRYRMWSARENDRLPPELRKQVESLAKSAARRAWAKQKETEAAQARAAEPKPPRKKPKPRVPPALTKYQIQHQKRKAAMEEKPIEAKSPEEKTGRKKLPDERWGVTHRFCIHARNPNPVNAEDNSLVDVEGYVTTGCYPDGRVGEILVRIGKPGSTEALLDEWAKTFSIALQSGADFFELCMKHVGTRFEPSGGTAGKLVPRCTSLVDYICRWLLKTYAVETLKERGMTL